MANSFLLLSNFSPENSSQIILILEAFCCNVVMSESELFLQQMRSDDGLGDWRLTCLSDWCFSKRFSKKNPTSAIQAVQLVFTDKNREVVFFPHHTTCREEDYPPHLWFFFRIPHKHNRGGPVRGMTLTSQMSAAKLCAFIAYSFTKI